MPLLRRVKTTTESSRGGGGGGGGGHSGTRVTYFAAEGVFFYDVRDFVKEGLG